MRDANNVARLDTPILFLIFNRPHLTEQVFSAIREARPSRLYIAADGPRKNKPGELENCLAARSIAMNVDWECEVNTLFRDGNLGCGKGVSTAISWFFEHEEAGIILEDDCLPSPDFFPFCTQLLEHYRNDNRVMAIGGCNLVPESQRKSEYSYCFSNHNNIWGWATWRRAWDLYDYEMSDYQKVKRKRYLKKESFSSDYEFDYFQWVFERTFLFPAITWDYQWEFVRRINSGLTIFPSKNLITNLGFGEDATHTTNPQDKSSNLKREQLSFPLQHPAFVLPDREADKLAFIEHYTNLITRVKSNLKSFLPDAFRDRLFKFSMDRFVEAHTATVVPDRTVPSSPVHRKKVGYSSAHFR